MDDVDYKTFTELISNLTLQNKQLRRANINKDKTIKHLGRVIKKLKEDATKSSKPHYKNGRRGSKYNG